MPLTQIEYVSCLVHPPIDPGNLLHPPAAIAMLERHDLRLRPVKVIGDVGYLLVKLLQGVA
jgi:hypothetical protein